jgi:hypothetical protein
MDLLKYVCVIAALAAMPARAADILNAAGFRSGSTGAR